MRRREACPTPAPHQGTRWAHQSRAGGDLSNSKIFSQCYRVSPKKELSGDQFYVGSILREAGSAKSM